MTPSQSSRVVQHPLFPQGEDLPLFSGNPDPLCAHCDRPATHQFHGTPCCSACLHELAGLPDDE